MLIAVYLILLHNILCSLKGYCCMYGAQYERAPNFSSPEYGLWKLQLELWNMSPKLLNWTLFWKNTMFNPFQKKLFSLFSIHFLVLLHILLLKQARKGCQFMNMCARWKSPNFNMKLFRIRDHLQILVLISSNFQQINQLLVLLKSSENRRFSDYFIGNRS